MDFNKFLKISLGFWAVFWLLVSCLLSLISPVAVLADEANLSGSSQGTAATDIKLSYPWSGATSTSTPLTDLVSRFYNIALAAVGVAALGAIVYGGILYTVSAGNSSKQTEARSWIGGAIAGLALLLGASLILRTIGVGVSETGQLTEPGLPSLPASAPPAISGKWPPDSLSSGTYGDVEARKILTDNKITVNKSDCTSIGQTNCTSLDGIPKSTIDYLKNLEDKAGKPIVVTGGTEYWLHGTHGVGKPIVDVRYDPSLLPIIKDFNTPKKISEPWKIKTYQCEVNTAAIPCDGSKGTPDHIHIVFRS